MGIVGTLEELNIARNYITPGSGGISLTSDMFTYPKDLQAVPEGTYPKTTQVAYFGKQGYFYTDAIWFEMRGDFRAYEEQIIGDPNSVLTPVMANVYFAIGQLSSMSSKSELSISFKVMETPYPPPEDPKVRVLCEGRFDPALEGECRFQVVLEVDMNANVKVIDYSIPMGTGNLSDNAPNGFSLRIE